MPKCTKDYEIELDDGRTIEVTVTVDGFFDENFGADADGNRGVGRWLINSWKYKTEEELDEETATEVHEKTEEKVFEESWDFENASESDDSEVEELE